ncbi:hypothetical protein B0H19DRAFT_1063524 [Mycena capillaripes]|nr:hypothetical protein B0H19DRAFT_1063524 [Mycena capillaripes]
MGMDRLPVQSKIESQRPLHNESITLLALAGGVHFTSERDDYSADDIVTVLPLEGGEMALDILGANQLQLEGLAQHPFRGHRGDLRMWQKKSQNWGKWPQNCNFCARSARLGLNETNNLSATMENLALEVIETHQIFNRKVFWESIGRHGGINEIDNRIRLVTWDRYLVLFTSVSERIGKVAEVKRLCQEDRCQGEKVELLQRGKREQERKEIKHSLVPITFRFFKEIKMKTSSQVTPFFSLDLQTNVFELRANGSNMPSQSRKNNPESRVGIFNYQLDPEHTRVGLQEILKFQQLRELE